MCRVFRIAARLAKSAAIPYCGASHTIIKVCRDFQKSVVQKSGALLKIVVLFLTRTIYKNLHSSSRPTGYRIAGNFRAVQNFEFFADW